jgi:hypothetical protein
VRIDAYSSNRHIHTAHTHAHHQPVVVVVDVIATCVCLSCKRDREFVVQHRVKRANQLLAANTTPTTAAAAADAAVVKAVETDDDISCKVERKRMLCKCRNKCNAVKRRRTYSLMSKSRWRWRPNECVVSSVVH